MDMNYVLSCMESESHKRSLFASLRLTQVQLFPFGLHVLMMGKVREDNKL